MPCQFEREHPLLQPRVNWSIQCGAAKIGSIDKRCTMPAVLERDELVFVVQFGHCMEQMACIPADARGLVLHKPRVNADLH
jgi:hypothetical protein